MSKRIPTLLGLIFLCLSVWLLITSNTHIRALIDRLDDLGYDLQLKARVLTGTIPETNVAIIDIDDASLKAEGRWPWPRSKIARLVDKLNEEGAAVVAFDIFFSEHEKNIAQDVLEKLKMNNVINADAENVLVKNESMFDEDTILANTLAKTNAVLAIGFLPRAQFANQLPPPLLQLSKKVQQELYIMEGFGYISNIPELEQAAPKAGFINIFPDSDGIIRHAPLIMEYKGGIYPSLALQAVLSYLQESIKLITPTYGNIEKLEGVQIGSIVIPVDETGQVLIPFVGKSYTFPFYSATDVLNNRIPSDALLGKVLFVGTSATGLGDLHATAIQNPFPGVEIQATLVNGMLKNDFSIKPAWTFGANVFLTLFFGLISAFWFPRLGAKSLGSIIILFPPATLMLNNWFWSQTGFIISLLLPVLVVLVNAIMNMIYGYVFESRRRERLRAMFGQYVPQKHIDEMLKATGTYALQGEDREMSVLFADIRGFTTISEGLKATELVELLNTFFTPMTEIIFHHNGTIDKYVGDLIMAFWGAPLKDKHHARHAIESALGMQKKVIEMQALLVDHHWPTIRIGIGINSGLMSVGDMGSRFRRNYTVLGDAVNLGSRVEGLTKFYGVGIIITEFTQKHQANFIFRKLDLVRVKGKQQGVAIFEAICKKSELTPALEQELSEYHLGLAHYFAQQWDLALASMTTLHETFPDKLIYQIYIDRINHIKSHPLPDDWDGVYEHTSK